MKNSFFLLMFFVFLGCNPPLPEADVSITKNSDPTSPSGSASITVSTIAGVAITGAFLGDLIIDGTLGDARLWETGDIVRDSAGNLFVSETYSHVIRKITPAGVVTTFAGLASGDGSTAGFINGTGTMARFNEPNGLTIDASNNIYVADYQNKAIRKITPSGVVTTFLDETDGLGAPFDIVFDSAGNLFITESYEVKKYIPGSGVTVFAGDASVRGNSDGNGTNATFNNLKGITIDPTNDDLYVADYENQSIRKITPDGIVSTFSGGTIYPEYISLSTSPLTLYVTSYYLNNGSNVKSNAITKIDENGNKHILAGNDSESFTSDNIGADARFNYPMGVTFHNDTLYVAQYGGVRTVDVSNGSVTSFVGALGNLSTVNGQGSSVRFNTPTQAVKDSQGNLFVADNGSHCIRKITPGGVVSTFAGVAGTAGSINGTGAIARFKAPSGIAIDSSDHLYVADAYNHAIRKITPSGVVTTIAGMLETSGSSNGTGTAARFNMPHALALDISGNIYVSDTYNNLIRKIDSSGVVTTLAGDGTPGAGDGPAPSANFYFPIGITVNSSGDVFVADSANNSIRKISSAGNVTTIGASAGLVSPMGISVDSDGYLYVGDFGNSLIRKISPTGMVSNLLGSFGDLSSVDGNSTTARVAGPALFSLHGNDIYFTEAPGTIRKFNYK